MNISFNWLKDYLKFDLTAEQVSAALTSTGLEVEHMETVEQIPGGLAGVIVAEVVECTEHPDSDHLHITRLNTGAPELVQVVCGNWGFSRSSPWLPFLGGQQLLP